MDDQKDKDVSVSWGDLGECTATVSEHVDGKSETPVESMACEAQVSKIEGSNEACGGEDVILEVDGSCVFVDSVCSNSNGVRVGGEEHLNDEEIFGLGGGGSAEAGVKRDLRSVSSVGDVVGVSGARKSGVSGGEVSSCHGLEAGFGGPLVEEIAAEESLERNKMIGSESAGGVVDDMSAHENRVENDDVQDRGTGNRVEGSNADVGSTGGETQVVHAEDIGVVSAEDGLGRGLPNDDAEKGSEIFSGAGYEARGSGAKIVVGPSTVVYGTVSEETQVVEEEVDRESENADVVSTGGETQVVHADIGVVSAEDALERGLPNDDAEKGSEIFSVAGYEAWGSRAKNVVGPSTVVSGTVSEETQVVDEVDRESENADVGSTGGETQVVHAEDIGVVSAEDGLERGLPNDDAEEGSEMVSGAGYEARGSGAENVVGPSTVLSDTVSEETQVVGEEVDRESENAVAQELFKGAEQGREMDAAGEDEHKDVETQSLGISDDETLNPGSRIAVAGSSTTVEYSSFQMQVVEDAAVMVSNEGLNPKVDAAGIDSTVGITSSSEQKKIPVAEADERGTGKDSVISAHSKSLDEQNPVAVTREVPELYKEEFMCSTMEGTETDSFDENLSFSLEELQGNFGRVDGSTENHCNVYADSPSFCHPTQVVGSEDATNDKNVHPDENHQQSQLEGCFDPRTAHYVAQVDSNTTQAMEIDEQVTTAELDEMLSCSGNFHNFKDGKLSMDTELDTQVTGRGDEIPLMNNQEALNSNVKVQMPTDNDQQLKLEERLDKSGACHLAQPQIASNVGKNMVVEQEVNDAEQVNSVVGNEMEVQKQLTGEVVGGEVSSAVDGKASLIPTVEVTYSSVQVINEDEGLRTAEGDKSAAGGGLSGVGSTVGHELQVEEQVTDAEQAALHGEQEIEVEEHDSDTEKPETNEEKFVNRVTTRAGSLVKSHQGSFLLPLEDREFYVSDLVWGKVRSHPWWPGQIYDPADASEKAMKYHKKDCFLVAYFGDRTFAWVDASQLKPFYSHFSQVEKQSNAEVFQNAVSCALEEVSRRIELGLACPCIPNDAYDEIRLQIVENAGIRQESSVREGVDKSASAQSFQPDKLVQYMKALALSLSVGADRLELVIAKAQLLTFFRLKGYCQLPEFQFCGGLVEDGVDTSHFVDKMHTTPVGKDDEHIYSGQGTSETQRSSYHKRKHMYPRKKEKSLSELMTGSFDSLDDEFDSDGKAGSKLLSPSSSKKRKVIDFAGDDSSQDGRKTISLAKVSSSTPNLPKPSFKIGDCIRRVASQMTGSPSVLKSNSERLQKLDGDGSDVSFENFEDAEGKRVILPTDYSSLDDLLSQLLLAARDPMKGYSFLNIVISFFSDFRNSIISDRHAMARVGGKRKKSSQILGSPETFEFEDMSDTYWTDRVIQNGAEEEEPSTPTPTPTPPAPAPAATGKNSRGYQIVPVELKPVHKSRRSYSRKQYSDTNHDLTPRKPPGYVDENSPAELVINFSEVDIIPPETNLNKMFRRFGPLKESETEVDRESSRARVVFKKCSDAEVAHSSATKFNIFGPIAVNYQLSYTISEPFKALAIVTSLGEEYAT